MYLQNISNQVSNSYVPFYTYQTFHKTKYMLPLNMKQLMTFLLTKMLLELGSITTNKASGGDGIPVELFQILKDDAVKVLHSICQQIWKAQQWPQDWKRSVFIPISKKDNIKEWSNAQLHSSHTLVKWCSKFSKPGFNSTWTVNFKMFILDLEKADEPEIKLPTSVGSSKKQESSRKNIYLCFIDSAKGFVWITTNCVKFWKRWKCQTIWPASWEICVQVRKQQLELAMEQQTCSKSGQEYIKTILSPCLFNLNAEKCWAGWSTSWNQDCWEK